MPTAPPTGGAGSGGEDSAMDKHLMTPEGHRHLKDELRRLKAERPRIVREIAAAREHGDLSENAEYHAAKERQGLTEARIKEIEAKVGRAEVIDISTLSGDRVQFGATVSIVDEDTEAESTYRIVGADEADANEGRLSIAAPLARALVGRKVGDSVEIETPGGRHTYEITAVAFG